MQALRVLQDEVHSQRSPAECEEGAGSDGRGCGSVAARARGEDEPLFLELESEGAEVRSETAGLEILCDAVVELTEALWVQTSALQGQAHLEERLCAQMERLSISLDQHCNSQQELLEALQVVARGFGHGLGPGLGVWTRFGTRWEEWSEGEEDEGQEQRRGWNDTLS